MKKCSSQSGAKVEPKVFNFNQNAITAQSTDLSLGTFVFNISAIEKNDGGTVSAITEEVTEVFMENPESYKKLQIASQSQFDKFPLRKLATTSKIRREPEKKSVIKQDSKATSTGKIRSRKESTATRSYQRKEFRCEFVGCGKVFQAKSRFLSHQVFHSGKLIFLISFSLIYLLMFCRRTTVSVFLLRIFLQAKI